MDSKHEKLNIVHIAPNARFSDGWGFQDNLLPKYHNIMGHRVTLITTVLTHKNGARVETVPESFTSKDGFEVIRLSYKKYFSKKLTGIFTKLDVYGLLTEINPDVIFYHGLCSATIFDVIRYKKENATRGRKIWIIQDNHLDYNIGTTVRSFKDWLLRAYYRLLNRFSQKHVAIVYGVTPWRKQYAEDYYKISPLKTDVLIMGADDEKINFAQREQIRSRIRAELGIGENEFLVATGGKIDQKKKTDILMEACADVENLKLLVFGAVNETMQQRFDELLERHENIMYIGWLPADKVYDYFFAADLVCFPGQHSVLWEQACAAKTPCLFGRWEGMEHVNNGGNSDFLDKVDADSIRRKLESLHFTEEYAQMKKVAESEATDIYLYSGIAKKSLTVAMEGSAGK